VGRHWTAGRRHGGRSWPFAVRTQQGERVRRVGVLMNLNAEDPVSIAPSMPSPKDRFELDRGP